jgi:N-carbamoylputrescine amidase
MKVAACQMVPELGNIPANLEQAERLIEEAFSRGASWVILPEFFPTAMGFHSSLIHCALPLDGPAVQLLLEQARKHHGYVGGSFVLIKEGGHYNTFVLAAPDGRLETHDKDTPTWWEHCYFRGGSDDGILETDIGKVGAILCWELIRWKTPKRLKGRIDFAVSGSCWPGMPQKPPFVKKLYQHFDRVSLKILDEAPIRMARLLGVPVIHASHAGPFKAKFPILNLPRYACYQGETKIVDAQGEVLAKRTMQDGAGVAVADIEPRPVAAPEPLKDGIYIPEFSLPIRVLFDLWWTISGIHGKFYYARLKKKHPETFMPKRFKMVQNGSKWHKTVRNGIKPKPAG